MNEAIIRKKIRELNDTVTLSHVSRVAKTVGEEGVYIPERPAEGAPVEESLEVLGLHIKYLLFDLEATRRENRYLRQMLETRPPTTPDDDRTADPGL